MGNNKVLLLIRLNKCPDILLTATYLINQPAKLQQLKVILPAVLSANFYRPLRRENFHDFSSFLTLFKLFFFVYMTRKHESSLF